MDGWRGMRGAAFWWPRIAISVCPSQLALRSELVRGATRLNVEDTAIDLLRRAHSRLLLSALLLAATWLTVSAAAQDGGWRGGPHAPVDIAVTKMIEMGGGAVQVDFAKGHLDLGVDPVLAHLQSAVSAVVAYYGRFPVARARV